MKPFVNCKIESLGNALKKFNKDYKILLNNLVFFLYIDNNILKIRIDGLESFENLFEKNGLLMNTYSKINNIEEALRSNLNEKTAIILKIDSFYQPFSKKYYNKIHKKHNIYIKDFNQLTGIVSVVEEEYSDSENYIDMQFDIEQIKLMYNGYIKNFYDTKEDLGDTVYIIEQQNNNEFIPSINREINKDLIVFKEYFNKFYNSTINEKIESIVTAIKLKKIRLDLEKNDKEQEYIKNQIKSLNKIRKYLIINEEKLLHDEINIFMEYEMKIFRSKNENKSFLFRNRDKFYRQEYLNINFNFENYDITFSSDKYIVCDIEDDMIQNDNFVSFKDNEYIKILEYIGTDFTHVHKLIKLDKIEYIKDELKLLGLNVTHINHQNNSINGYLLRNNEKYFFKILSKEEAKNEIIGYLTIIGRIEIAELLSVINYDNCIVLIHEFDKNIGNNCGLLNDLIVEQENKNGTDINNKILNVIQEYIKNWSTYIIRNYYPMEKFYKKRIDNRLIKWYENADFINLKITVNEKYTYNIKDILNETEKYFSTSPNEKCVLSQGDPNLLNIGIKPIFFDYSTAGYNALYGEIAAFFWSTILADAYFCPKYHKSSYYNHDAIYTQMEKFKPEIKIEFNNEKVLINLKPKTTEVRKKIIRILMNSLKNYNYKINYRLKYFLVMRMLCVLNIEKMEFYDKWYVLSLMIILYSYIGDMEKINLDELLDFFEEV